MEMKIFNNTGERSDGVVFDGVDYSNPIMKRWIHKQKVVTTGETEDDWHLEEVPVLIEEYDIQKAIDEASKGADLQSMIMQVLRTGDESFLNTNPGFNGDITNIPTDPIEAHNLAKSVKDLQAALPGDLSGMNVEEVLGLDKAGIEAYLSDLVNKAMEKKETKVESTEEVGKENK